MYSLFNEKEFAMQPVFSLSKRSIDQLETDLIHQAHDISAREYAFLVDLREFDLRQGWKEYHFNHCAEWLSMKCGIDTSTGREKVRVARALFDLPHISAAFESGELSYTKARSLTRVATAHNEAELLSHAIRATTDQVQARCRQLRNGDRAASTVDANRLHKERYLSRSIDQNGRMTISIELPVETGELVMKAIEQAVVESEDDSFHAWQADALVEVAKSYLSGESTKTTSSAEQYQIMVHVDEKALRSDASRDASSDLPIETVRRLCCDGAIVPVTEDKDKNPLNVGRKHRIVQPALRRALQSRDKHCSYPGCSHDKWLDAHHIKHWADGGETKLENTLLLCSKHHRLLHEGGFTIKHNYKNERYFETSQGKIVTWKFESSHPVHAAPNSW
jgi:hypothetical protein